MKPHKLDSPQIRHVRFTEEVREQEAELGFKFDYIVVCVATGSTQGGMIVGFKEDEHADRVISIDASGTVDQTRAQVKRSPTRHAI